MVCFSFLHVPIEFIIFFPNAKTSYLIQRTRSLHYFFSSFSLNVMDRQRIFLLSLDIRVENPNIKEYHLVSYTKSLSAELQSCLYHSLLLKGHRIFRHLCWKYCYDFFCRVYHAKDCVLRHSPHVNKNSELLFFT